MFAKVLFLAVVLSLCAVFVQAQADAIPEGTTLQQVIVVTRHGSRTPLSKEASTLVEGSSSLTASGMADMYNLGLALKERYKDRGIIDTYSNVLATLESSYFDRTIVSADMLAQGLYPAGARGLNLITLNPPVTQNNIPVYARDINNDITIRAYDKCPNFNAKLVTLYSSSAWAAVETTYADVLEKLATIMPEHAVNGKVPLEMVWNCYDLINVAKVECEGNDEAVQCTSLEHPEYRNQVTDAEWTQVKAAAHTAELLKFSYSNTGDMLGGNLLVKIVRGMTGDPTQKFGLYSAHYPTILGVLNALLGADSANLFTTIPDYASYLAFELLKNDGTGKQTVRVVFRDGGTTNIKTLVTSKALTELVSQLPYKDDEAWCKACDNSKASPCMAALLAASPATPANVEVEEKECSAEAVGFFFFGGAIGMLLFGGYLIADKHGYLNGCKGGGVAFSKNGGVPEGLAMQEQAGLSSETDNQA